jgi:RND family efflux transporter MFP subunit
MDPKTALLDQLRIDRRETPARAGERLKGWIGLGAAAAVVVAGLAIFAFTREGVAVHSAVAMADGAGGASSGGGSLLDASGYVVALREATVSAKSIYKVREVLVQEGQPVKEGELMATLDDTNARAALEQSKAQVKQLEATVLAAKLAADDARPIFLRDRTQLGEGLISRESFDTSKANYDAAQAAVSVAEGNLDVAKAAVQVNQRYEDDTVIKAPFDGVVTVKSAQPGEIVSPQFLGGGGIAKIVDMGSLEVDVDVGENFINRVHPEQAVTITLNAYADQAMAGRVIAIIPTADRSKATVKVRIGFDEKDPRIVPEMGARVSFLDGASAARAGGSPAQPAVVVPLEAVRIEGHAGVGDTGIGHTGIVFVISGDRVLRSAVRLGARSAGGQTILAGLKPGAQVAVGDLSKLADGSRVRVIQ